MTKFKCLLIIFGVIFLCSFPVMAQENPDENDSKAKIIPLPVVFYTPETGTGGGVYLMFYQEPDPDNPDQEMDVCQGTVIYTQKEQLQVAVDIEKNFRKGKNKLLLHIMIAKFPNTFYGIGPEMTEDNGESYNQEEYTIDGSYLNRIKKDMYFGPVFRFSKFQITETEADGRLAKDEIVGGDDATVAGGGLYLLWDQRNRSFFPEAGFRLEAKAMIFPAALGGDQEFSQLDFDYRKYYKIADRQILAFQGLCQLSEGTVPFQLLPQLGGSNIMRGYYEGRYRDHNLLAFQGEYRFPIYKRFSGVLFGSAGQVAGEINRLTTGNLKVAGGAGLRYALDEKQKLNIRMDLAVGEDSSSGIYLGIGEAF